MKNLTQIGTDDADSRTTKDGNDVAELVANVELFYVWFSVVSVLICVICVKFYPRNPRSFLLSCGKFIFENAQTVNFYLDAVTGLNGSYA